MKPGETADVSVLQPEPTLAQLRERAIRSPRQAAPARRPHLRREQRFAEARQRMSERITHWLENDDHESYFHHVGHRRRMERVLELMRDVQGKVLDVGPFTGVLSERIIAQGGKELYGIDLHEGSLRMAAQRGVIPTLADIEDDGVDFEDQTFDAAVMGDVMGYFLDPDFVMREIHRVLKSGAKFVLTVPNLASIGNRILAVFGHTPYEMDIRPFGGGYQRLYTFKSLRNLLTSNGFDVVSMEANLVHWPLHRLPVTHRLFNAKAGARRGRLMYWHWLGRVLPKWGEDMIVQARKRG